MKRFVASSLAILAMVLIAPASNAGERIRIKGSDTIGGRAMPEIAEAYAKKYPGVQMDVYALGSSTAFVGLFDGSAEIGESSRPINEKELETAKQLGLKLQEVVIGFDGVAVIVHRDNPVKELNVGQLSSIFTGKVSNWKQVGGKDSPIRIISRPGYSGTHVFFKEKALRRGNAKGPEEFAASTEFIEENGEILKAVAADPRAVSYVGLGWLEGSVKSVPVVAKPGEPGVPPNVESVRTGKYPLYRPLLMYVPAGAKPFVLDFVRYVLSPEGVALMAKNGFIAPDTSAGLPPFLAGARPPARVPEPAPASPVAASAAKETVPPPALPEPARAAASEPTPGGPAKRLQEVVRVGFPSGAVTLDAGAGQILDQVASKLAKGQYSVVITGHADSKGRPETNQKVALARAHAVANGLLKRGVAPGTLRVEASGSDAPVGSNDTVAGRAQNRRVDIEILSR